MAKHIKQGRLAEKIAATYLEKNGYQIVDRNYRSGKAEVDIIAKKGIFMVFVEVKSLKKVAFGHPETNINSHKTALLFQAANAFQFETKWNQEIRFDAIAVTFLQQAYKIEHFEDAFS
jgi:putative endonuclease